MKVYTLTNEYPGLRAGGIGTYISQLEEVLGERMIVDAIEHFPVRFALLKRLYKATQRGEQIWVHHAFPVGFAALLLRIFCGRSYTVFLHGNDFDTARAHKVRRVLMRFVLRGARQVVTNSQALAEDVEHAYGVIPQALNPWLPQDAKDAFSELDLRHTGPGGTDVKTILTVGRFVPRKGFGLLVDVAQRLPQYRFVFVGPKNRYAEELEKGAHARGIENIEFVYDATRAQTLQLFKSASLFAMPTIKSITDREGFGIVYLEAQYAGLPVVATCYKESLEAIAPSLQHYLLQTPTVENCVESIEKLMKAPVSPQELRAFVEENHTVQARVQIIESLYA